MNSHQSTHVSNNPAHRVQQQLSAEQKPSQENSDKNSGQINNQQQVDHLQHSYHTPSYQRNQRTLPSQAKYLIFETPPYYIDIISIVCLKTIKLN